LNSCPPLIPSTSKLNTQTSCCTPRSELSASTAECERLKDLASSFEAGREEEIEAATRRQESLEVEILAMQEVVKGAR
jgi:hypothetical protein